MKRIIAAAVLLFLVISVYLTGLYCINKTCSKANELISQCNTAYKNNTDAEKAAKKLEDYWSEKENLLSVFANHTSIDEIELAISTMAFYSKTTENELFFEYSDTVKTLIHQLIEDTVPSIHSIF